MTRPRPIHSIHREIQDTPDEAEPSFSYERRSFLASQEEDMEDEFHRRLANHTPSRHSQPNTPSQMGRGGGGSSSSSGGGGGKGIESFWRSRGTTSGPSISFSEDETHHRFQGDGEETRQTPKGQRRPSMGGGIGAALLLHPTTPTAASPSQARQSTSQPQSLEGHAQPSPTFSTSVQQQQQPQQYQLHGTTKKNGGKKLFANMKRMGSALSHSSSHSSGSTTPISRDNKKKDATKQRAEARRIKMEAQQAQVDVGHEVLPVAQSSQSPQQSHEKGERVNFFAIPNDHYNDNDGHYSTPAMSTLQRSPTVGDNKRSISIGTNDTRSSGTSIDAVNSIPSDHDPHNSTRSASSVLFSKSSSLIFPTGVEATSDKTTDKMLNVKLRKISALVNACDSIRFPFKKKLILNSLNLTAEDIPIKDLYSTSLGNSLHKLSLAGNRLSTIPPKLVTCLPVLKTLDLSQCELHHIPERWNLPQLKRLNLSHNKLTDFPEEAMLEGLLELHDLNMYGNKVSDIIVPQNPRLLAKLEVLNLGYNDLSYIPEDLDRLKALRTFKVMHNLLEKIPMRVCDMDLKAIDVSSNPVIQPPIETCERGIAGMKRYYHLMRMEDKSKAKLHAIQHAKTSIHRQPKKPSKAKIGFGIGSFSNKPKRSSTIGTSSGSVGTSSMLGRKTSNGSAISQNTDLSADGGRTSSEVPSMARHRDSVSKGLNRSRSLDHGMQSRKRSVHVHSPVRSTVELEGSDSAVSDSPDEVTVNDTLKVIFVGMAMVGKTSMIKRLIEGEGAAIPKRDDRTVGVDIYEWDPKIDRRFEHIDSRIELGDKELQTLTGDVNVKFSVWDFAGQHVYHATHQLFFSQRALYVLVWDMGATNPATRMRKTDHENNKGAFSLTYDSDEESEDEDDVMFSAEEEARRADRALERDIDEKVQFWVDCIQSSAPGAAILPVASFDDYFDGSQEAKRRCDILKQRLLKHEARRIQGIKNRLSEYYDLNRAHDEGAQRLRKLLSPFTRPKLIFGNDGQNNVVRVSGTRYTGFATLTQRIIDIATGRDKCNMRYPIFRGHVGARIPRMRLEVREAVRQMRDRFKVVEWNYFLTQLSDNGLTNVEDISDALHFLANIGELSYFGAAIDEANPYATKLQKASQDDPTLTDDEDDEEDQKLSIDASIRTSSFHSTVRSTMATTIASTISSREDESMATIDETSVAGLSQFVFLNPRWLVAAVACILRHDLDREIHETKRSLNSDLRQLSRSSSFYEANLNCPVITADDACMLWQAKKFTKKAAERALEFSSNMTIRPFEFLQLLLIRFGVFVPIDLGIDKALLGGKEYSFSQEFSDISTAPEEITIKQPNTDLKATYFFLPSLLGPGEPAEVWTYKSTDSWKATLCHSILFPDGVPPGLMERITASVLSKMHDIAHKNRSVTTSMTQGDLTVKEILCWRTSFLVKLGLQIRSATSDGNERVGESIVEVFCGLVDKDSHLCVGSEYMSIGSRRLVISAKGQEGNGGRKIWNGGYLLVVKAVQQVMREYEGLEYEKQGFCPDCLAKKAIHEASSWDLTLVRSSVKNGEAFIRCRHGHKVDTRLLAGPVDMPSVSKTSSTLSDLGSESDPTAPINDLLRAVVVVALWDGKTRKIVRCGSGFIADKKRGLIVTASHTLMNIWGDKSTPFGENYYGLRQGKVLIGVIPQQKDEASGTEAVFRYFAKIVSKDPSIDSQGVCHLDACVLRITTRMEQDVASNVEACGEQPEKLLLNNPHALKQERLPYLKITTRCELDEQVRIVGYNQGGEGVFGAGVTLNRYVDFARGYVCKKFAGDGSDALRHRFKPREEIVIICPTIGGHSGGPCLNQQGEVIGILSRADPAESQRCYLVPTHEWQPLLKEAKRIL